MDEKWIEQELGKLVNSSAHPPDALDNETRILIRKQAFGSKRRSVGMSRLKAIGVLPAATLLIVLVFFSTMALLHFAGPAGGGELALGRYETEDGFAWVELSEGDQFVFNRNLVTSYRPMGSYSIQEDELLLYVADTEQYKFSVEGNTIIFQGGGYAESLVEIGTVFTLSGQDYLELEGLPDPYPVELAKENGDIVNGHNIEKLDRFVDNFQSSRSDWVRITMYTIEGDAIIHDLQHENGKLTLYIDTTRDKFGTRAITEHKVSDVYKEVRDDVVYYLAKVSGEEIVLSYVTNIDGNQSLDSLQIIDITAAEANTGYQFSIETNEEVEDVSLIYVPSSSGEVKAAHVLPGVNPIDGQFTVDFNFSQVNGNARLLAFQGSVGIVAGTYRLTDDMANQEYYLLQKQGGEIPQINEMTMVVDGNRSSIVADGAYSLGNEVYFELSVSEDVTMVEYVFFPEDADSTFAMIYPGIEGAQGEYRIELNTDKTGQGYFLLYNQGAGNNVVVRSGQFHMEGVN